MKIIKNILFTSLFFILPFLAFSQAATISGTVKDDNDQPVKGARVTVANTSLSAVTDSLGNFTIENVPAGTAELEITGPSGLPRTEHITVNATNEPVKVVLTGVSQDALIQNSDNIPTVTLSDDDLGDQGSQNVSSVLTASRDAFTSASSFVFSAARFRVRGYDWGNAPTLMNGALVTDLSNGRSEFNIWSGLNDVVRSKEGSFGLQPSNISFGGIGGVSSIDSRASHQRKQLQVSYAASNRVYTNRLVLTYGSGLNAKGWAYSVSYSRRWADEGYIDGTFYDGNSFFGSVEKRINQSHSVSLTGFAAQTKNGRSSPSVKEIQDLAGTHYYNPNWGYLNGKKRNASVGNSFQPAIILTHDWDINEKSSLETAVSYEFGKYKVSGFDWYKAEDPRPDYYRYLPSFDPSYGADPVSAARDSAELANYLSQNEDARQVNWEKIYQANQMHDLALYVISNRVIDAKKYGFNTIYNNQLTDHIALSGGVTYQKQDLEYYKQLDDLLGGKRYVNLNQFADLTTLVDSSVIQLDLNNPDAVVMEGDKYSYDYFAHLQQSSVWAQSVFKFDRFDFFLSGQLTLTDFYRTGQFKNGVFPENSFGDSKKFNFTSPAGKAGVTYKYNGRNYVFVNGAYIKRAPLFENTFISPRTNNYTIAKPENETISSVEGGYIYTAPRLKAKATGYYTQFEDMTDIRSFYYDDLKTFVNYTLTGIAKRHTGVEISIEASLGKGFSASAVAAIGEYIYTNRPTTTITQDNKDTLLANGDLVYSKNLHVAGGPQKAYTIGLNYRSKKYWYVYVNLNYFSDIYTDFNPARRTLSALEFVDAGTAQWESILGQEKRDPQFTLDVSGGWSWKVNNRFKSLKKNTFIVFNLGITNLLNNQNLTTIAYEQLRFDNVTHDINSFPPKYAYAFGTTFFTSITLRFN